MGQPERQKAYRIRRIEYVTGLEKTLRDIAQIFSKSDKATAIKVREMCLKALGE